MIWSELVQGEQCRENYSWDSSRNRLAGKRGTVPGLVLAKCSVTSSAEWARVLWSLTRLRTRVTRGSAQVRLQTLSTSTVTPVHILVAQVTGHIIQIVLSEIFSCLKCYQVDWPVTTEKTTVPWVHQHQPATITTTPWSCTVQLTNILAVYGNNF